MIIFLCLNTLVMGQMKLDLANLLQENQIKPINRSLSALKKQPEAVEMDAAAGDGLAVLTGISFKTGTIEVQLMGENSPGRSFVGIAFNIVDDGTYEAIYFRPFNFVAEEPISAGVHHPLCRFLPESLYRR